jgi:hypothetical protein
MIRIVIQKRAKKYSYIGEAKVDAGALNIL